MHKRTIFFITITLLIVLAFVQVTLVSAAEENPPPCEGEDCPYVPPDPPPACENPGPEGCPLEPEPDPEPQPYCPEGECFGEETTPPEVDCAGNPGNAKCVGKAGEKEDMGGFWAPLEGGKGTHGRSDPDKHPGGHPTE